MLFCVQVNAAESLSYSGRLVQTNGAPVTGTVNLRAELAYTNALTTILCSDDISGVVLSKGVFHIKLDFACTGGKTLNQVLSQSPANESVAIQITDVTNSKSYSFQAIHAVPYANVASIAAQLEQNGAGDGEFLKWDNSTKQWIPGTVSGATGGTVTSVSVSGPLSVTTPTSTPSISIDQADSSTSGYLSSADWNTFNSKQGTIAAGTTAQYYRGDKSWQTLDTSAVPENVNLYFTNARALGVPLTGFATAAGAIIATDTALDAFGKAQGQINAINSAAANFLVKNSTDSITGVVNVGTTGLLQLVYVPVGLNDATNKSYVDSEVGNKVSKAGDTITGILTLNNDFKIKGGSNYVTVKGHATSANYNLTLPQTAGTAGYVLSTDGSGNTTWSSPAVGSATITDGSIVDADVNASAAIAQSKIANLTTDLASKVSATLTNGNILVGNGSNVATGVAVSGDATLSNTGVVTLANTAVTAGTYSSVTVDGKGRVTGGTNPAVVNSLGVTAPITNSGTASAPVIAMAAATTSVNGYLTSTDWNIFNNKQQAITAASTVTTGSITTSLQNGVNLNPFGVAAGNTGELRFYELVASGTNYTSLKAPDALTANINYVLPATAPTAGQVLSSSAAGVMSWISIPSAPVATVFGRSGAVVATAGDYTAAQVSYSPAGNIAASTVQAALDEIDSEKQGLISAGTTAQYFRGDKTFVDFGTDVRATALTGYAVGTNTALVATDSTLAAFQKVQGQINATNTAVAGKEPAITAGTTAQYIRGDKTLSTFATDAINSVLSTFALNGTSKPSVANTDSVVGAFGKVQKFINDINSDYVSKSANQTINGSLAINSVTGFITVPTPVNPNDAANKSYVDGFGQWTKTGSDIYFNTGRVGIGTTSPGSVLHVASTAPYITYEETDTTQKFFQGVDNSNFWIRQGVTSNNDLFTIKNDGNIGIGTNSPGYLLDLYATAPTLRIRSASNNASGATLKLTEDMIEHGGFLRYKSNTDTMDLGMLLSGVEVPSMSIVRANGNVGIGTTTPSNKFEVQKSFAGLSNTTAAFIGGTDTGIANSGIYVMQKDGSGINTNTSYLINAVMNNVSKFVVTGLGNVGVGTLTPAEKLSVTENSDSTTLINATNNSAGTAARVGITLTNAGTGYGSDSAGFLLGGTAHATMPDKLYVFANSGITNGIDITSNNGTAPVTLGTASTERMRITSSGNVGIGTSTPGTTLDVSGTFRTITPYAGFATASISNNNSGYGQIEILNSNTNSDVSYLSMHSAGNTAYQFGIQGSSFVISNTSGPGKTYNDIERFTITNTGNVGVNMLGPVTKFHVNGSMASTDWVGAGCEVACEGGGGYAIMYGDGHAVATVGWQTASDKRLKTDIESIENSLDKVLKLNGVQYHLIQDLNKEKQTGLIAQNVQKYFPDLVTKGKDGFLSLDYSRLVSPVIESIKEFYSKWTDDSKELHSEIDKLKNENEELKAAICEMNSKAKICNSLRKPASKITKKITK